MVLSLGEVQVGESLHMKKTIFVICSVVQSRQMHACLEIKLLLLRPRADILLLKYKRKAVATECDYVTLTYV